MPKKRRQLRPFEPPPPPAAAGVAELNLVTSAGLSAAICLLSWCWVQHPEQSSLLSNRRFGRLAPDTHLENAIAPFLERQGLLIRPPLALGLRAREMDVTWQLPLLLEPVSSAELAALLAGVELTKRARFPIDATQLWRDLGVSEVLGYLEAELQDHQFNPAWAQETEGVIERALERLSISECFYFCWLAVRDLASAYLRQAHAYERLAEALRWSLESKLARAHSERWHIRPMTRHAHRAETAIAYAFSSVVPQIGPSFLTEPPNEDRISAR